MGRFAILHSGATPKTEVAENWGGHILWATPIDLRENGKWLEKTEREISEKGFDSCATVLMPEGSLILSSRAPIGYISITRKPTCTNQGCKSIVPNQGQYSSEYLYYTLGYNVDKVKELGEGTTFQEISKRALTSISFLIAKSLEEQKKIASILSTVDEAIAQTEQLIAKQERLKTGLMQDLLTRGIDENGQLRNEATHEFKDSPLGRIPIEWGVKTIGELDISIIDGDRGKNYPSDSNLEKEGYCLFLNNSNISNLSLDKTNGLYITKERYFKLGKGAVQENDVIVTSRGTVGNIALVRYNDLQTAIRINSGMLIFRNINSSFHLRLFLYLWQYLFPREYLRVRSGSAQPQLPIKDLVKFRFLCIPKEEQKVLKEKIQSQQKNINQEQTKRSKLQSVKRGLMQDLLTGRVRH